MWPFSVKRPVDSLFEGFTDWHSHILPGVDDGVQTMEESLRILSRYESLGVRQVWLTPHIMEDIPNTTAGLRARFAELREAYAGPVRLHLAAENMMDSLFESRLIEGDLLPLGDGCLLVETSYFTPPMDFWKLLSRIKSQGYTPVLAHPERYQYMSPADYDRLKSMGVKLQLNLFSLFGFYGPEAQRSARLLLSKSYYDLFGTDLHSLKTLESALSQKVPLRIEPYLFCHEEKF